MSGQERPAFTDGNAIARTHGANSPRELGPIAERIEGDASAAAWWPGYLAGDEYRDAVAAWAWAEAVCEQRHASENRIERGGMAVPVTAADHLERPAGQAVRASRARRAKMKGGRGCHSRPDTSVQRLS